jgi:hypothetical protein
MLQNVDVVRLNVSLCMNGGGVFFVGENAQRLVTTL